MFQQLAMSLRCNSLISNFQLVVPPTLHMQWTIQVEKWHFALILPHSSAHFVENINNDQVFYNLIGWLDKRNNGMVKIKSACAGQNL